MTFGFRLTGDSGYWQVDENNPQLFLVNVYTLSRPSSTNAFSPIDIAGEMPIPVIHSPDTWAAMYRIQQTGSNTWSCYFISRDPNVNFYVYLFDRIPAGGARANWSLNVYGPDGRLNFAGDRKQFRPVNFVPQQIGSTTDPGQGVTVPNGKWGAVWDNPRYSGAAAPGGQGNRTVQGVKTYWTAISYFPVSFPSGTTVPTSQLPGGNTQPRNFLIVDLNGL
ncbi:BcepGomrgp24 [Burkholderia phage BcepGomr]|uniref:BcepGomrgp24 n=1 Tax=Burkholderia phage BcepGomr TaxID=437329 RepID=UPI00015034C5|nr:BcepGomrgp24 [Burkholderia phage BcepGomr]ABP63595.1 BcepGomrgp24 [Burkholderia phage BcepGomr]